MNAPNDNDERVDQQRIPAFAGLGVEEAIPPPHLKGDWAPDVTGLPPRAQGHNLLPQKDLVKPAPVVSKRKLEVENADAPTKNKAARTEEPIEEPVALDLNFSSQDDDSVPPGDDGIALCTENDVLCGRGGATNSHPGNKRFRELIDQYRRAYLGARKNTKPLINRAIVKAIRDGGGRFLKRERDGLWYEIGDHDAKEKCGQALRQKASIRKMLLQSGEQEETSQEQLHQGHVEDGQHFQQEQQQQQLQQQQRLEQVQQQQILAHQHQQMAQHAAAAAGHVALDPSTVLLVNPAMIQQAMANPVFNALLAMNKVCYIPVGVPQGNPAALPAPATMAAPMGNGGMILSKPVESMNAVAAPMPPAVIPAPLVAPAPTENQTLAAESLRAAASEMGNGGLILPKPAEEQPPWR